jgi:hypothetical protein
VGTSIYPITFTNPGIQETIVNAKGDLIVATAADAVSRLAVGTNTYVLTADSAEATGLKWAAPAAGGGGKVLQVVSTTLSTTFSAGVSGSFVDITGLSVSITPSAASSKVLILYMVSLFNQTGTNLGFMNLVRNSTNLAQGTGEGSRTVATNGVDTLNSYAPTAAISGNFLDAPATTSATTYKITMMGANGTMYVNRSSTDNNENNRPRFSSTITVMEIGA